MYHNCSKRYHHLKILAANDLRNSDKHEDEEREYWEEVGDDNKIIQEGDTKTPTVDTRGWNYKHIQFTLEVK
jgi:hypothetical protein